MLPWLISLVLASAAAPAIAATAPDVVTATIPSSATQSVQAPADPEASGLPGTPAVQPSLSKALGDLGYLTTGELADRCADTAPSSASYCFGYVAAVHDSARAYEVWLREKEFCIPPGTPQADLRRAFLTFVSAYPSHRSGQAASVVVVALKEFYPCPVVNGVPSVPRPQAGSGPRKTENNNK